LNSFVKAGLMMTCQYRTATSRVYPDNFILVDG
jgi:hypothetical protein